MDPDDAELERYAKISIAIARADDPDQVYAAHGLDEKSFEALEAKIEGALEEAMESNADQVPPFVDKYTKAMSKAQAEAEKDETPMSADAFANAIRMLGTSGDPLKAMERAGLSAQTLTRAARHFSSDAARGQELLVKLNPTEKKKPDDE
jgi:hypothetical protein